MKIDTKKYGFKEKWLDDKSGSWYEKKISYHPFLKDIKVVIDEDVLYLECRDLESSSSPCMIYKTKATENNLFKLLEWLGK